MKIEKPKKSNRYVNIDKIHFNNNKTWTLIQKGYTCGVFQLESSLGQTWAKKLKPENITELSILLALIRPAGLETGMLEQYCDIKQGKSKAVPFDDEKINKILKPTRGILVFQESLMALGKEIAWSHFDYLPRLVITDKLRKGIGKKDSKLINELEKEFIEGCLHNGYEKPLANKLFDMIKSAGRYAFNDAHAKKYAIWTYKTAYLKTLYPYEFYTVYMTYSKAKQKPKEELNKLINEARMIDIKIMPPNILFKNKEFKIITGKSSKAIIYGISHIKHVSQSDMIIIKDNDISSWQEMFSFYVDSNKDKKFRSLGIESLIKSGACDCFSIPRIILVDMLDIVKQLSNKEKIFIADNILNIKTLKDFKDLLIKCGNEISTKKRKEYVLSEASELNISQKDTFTWKSNEEQKLLGMFLTCSPIDDKEIYRELTCKQCYKYTEDFDTSHNIKVAAVIDEIIPLVTKKGKNPGSHMCQLIISDKTGFLRLACFPEQYNMYKEKMNEKDSYHFVLNKTGNGGWCVRNLSEII